MPSKSPLPARGTPSMKTALPVTMRLCSTASRRSTTPSLSVSSARRRSSSSSRMAWITAPAAVANPSGSCTVYCRVKKASPMVNTPSPSMSAGSVPSARLSRDSFCSCSCSYTAAARRRRSPVPAFVLPATNHTRPATMVPGTSCPATAAIDCEGSWRSSRLSTLPSNTNAPALRASNTSCTTARPLPALPSDTSRPLSRRVPIPLSAVSSVPSKPAVADTNPATVAS